MSTTETLQALTRKEYGAGFVTDIESDTLPPGLDEGVVRTISAKKQEPPFLLEWRLKAYRHWLTMKEPHWPNAVYPPIDYQAVRYYSAPVKKPQLHSLDEVDPELLKTYAKLGIPLEEQKRLANVAVDAVFDSVSVATTFKDKLGKMGVIFCSFSEAVREHPELIQKYLGTVVPFTDNYFAALNAAVFSDGSFCYIPKGVRCPMELSTYFRINAADTGQFERTLLIADEGASVSYLELPGGLHRPHARQEPAARGGGRAGGAGPGADQVLHGAELVPRGCAGTRRHLQLRHQAREVCRGELQDLLDAGGDRLGDHLEVPERDLAG
jgi:Fe-S cluster assembly protein SufB